MAQKIQQFHTDVYCAQQPQSPRPAAQKEPQEPQSPRPAAHENPAAQAQDNEAFDSADFDAKSRQLGSRLLYDALCTLRDLKDSPELSAHQRAQINLAIAKLIARG